MGYLDKLRAGIDAGKAEAAKEKEKRTEAKKKKREVELRKAKENPSKLGVALGKTGSFLSPAVGATRKAITKNGPKLLSTLDTMSRNAFPDDVPKSKSDKKEHARASRPPKGRRDHKGRKESRPNNDDPFSWLV